MPGSIARKSGITSCPKVCRRQPFGGNCSWRLASTARASTQVGQINHRLRSSCRLADLALFRPAAEEDGLTEAALLLLVLDGMTSKHSKRAYGKA